MRGDALWTAYANATLRIGAKRQLKIDLRQPLSGGSRRFLTELGLGATFAVITASNPNGRRAPAWRNQWRRLRIRARLASTNWYFIPADGESPDSSHREHGFAIVMSRSEAAALARSYGQLALYWFDGDAFWLDAALESSAPRRLP